jgi:hypothetical protein
LPVPDRACPRCADRDLVPAGFEMVEFVDAQSPDALLNLPLCQLGCGVGEVFTLREEDRDRHYVIEESAL